MIDALDLRCALERSNKAKGFCPGTEEPMVLPTPKSCKDDRGFWITVETARIQSRASLQDAEMDGGWMCVGVRGDESPGCIHAIPSRHSLVSVAWPAMPSDPSTSLETLPRAA